MNDLRQYVYVFDTGHDSIYKIGHAKDWRERLRQFQPANPHLRCIRAYIVRYGAGAEKAAHEFLRHKRYTYVRHGQELYQLSDDDIKALDEFMDERFSALRPPGCANDWEYYEDLQTQQRWADEYNDWRLKGAITDEIKLLYKRCDGRPEKPDYDADEVHSM